MKTPTETFEAFDVVVVPFPFTDKAATKRRPALVLSAPAFNVPAGHSVLAMITSAENVAWPLDTPIKDLNEAGLTSASIVRMKLFTLDEQLFLRKAGHLHKADQKAVRLSLAKLFASVL